MFQSTPQPCSQTPTLFVWMFISLSMTSRAPDFPARSWFSAIFLMFNEIQVELNWIELWIVNCELNCYLLELCLRVLSNPFRKRQCCWCESLLRSEWYQFLPVLHILKCFLLDCNEKLCDKCSDCYWIRLSSVIFESAQHPCQHISALPSWEIIAFSMASIVSVSFMLAPLHVYKRE